MLKIGQKENFNKGKNRNEKWKKKEEEVKRKPQQRKFIERQN